MHADDLHDFLELVKKAEELGLTPAEVWRGTTDAQEVTWEPDTRLDLERCARCKRPTAPENGYRTGAGFFCAPCSHEFDS